MEKIINDLKTANKIIQKRHRYSCGLMDEDKTEGIKEERANFFFESPDGQNGELYYELIKLGFRHSKREAEYYWKVTKAGYQLGYTEGDVYITKLI